MVDFKSMAERAGKEREWRKTEIGRLFDQFEFALIEYWMADSKLGTSDARLRHLDDAMNAARGELLLMIRGW